DYKSAIRQTESLRYRSAGLLRDLACQAFLLQRSHYVLVIEIPGDFKRLGAFYRGLVFYSRNCFDGFINGLDAFAAAKVNTLDFQGLHFFTLRARGAV